MLKEKRKDLFRFIKSTDFFRGYLLTTAILVPVVVFSFFNLVGLGITFALGVLLASPSDIPGSSKHRINGLLIAIFISLIGTLIGNLASENIWFLLPVVIGVLFLFSFISVFGFRASMVSFSGLLALVLGFADFGSQSRWVHLGLIAAGGLWYILASTLFLWMRPKMYAEQLLAQTMAQTARLLTLKKKTITHQKDRGKLLQEQFKLQAEITENHENLRDILLTNRKRSGKSNPMRRKVLIFINLVDIFELIISNSLNWDKLDTLTANQTQLIKHFEELLGLMANQLHGLSENMAEGKKIKKHQKIEQVIKQINTQIKAQTEGISTPENHNSDTWLLYGFLKNEIKLFEKIKSMERVMTNLIAQPKSLSRKRERQFITPTDYRWTILLENLSFSSPIFRHSLRLVTLFVLGIVVGKLFVFQNAYWILLTLVVIMRPSYGLTKERSQKRIAGTLIGGAIAFAIVLLVQNTTLYAILAIITFGIAFSMMKKNYVVAATFITLNIVFVYALLKPNAFEVIQFRVLDTAIGAALGFIGNFILWPSWEYRSIDKVMLNTLRANRKYLNEIDTYYHTKDKDYLSYKLARKHAFLEIGNLSASFQRMAQEPKSVQQNLGQLYRFSALSQTFLSSLAALGTFIRHHETTEASLHFESYIKEINLNLEFSEAKLIGEKVDETAISENIQEANRFISDYLNGLTAQKNEQLGIDKLKSQLHEAHLIYEQLKWLLKIAQRLNREVDNLV